MDRKEQSFKMARRLKKLRTSKELSHAKLSAELLRIYDIKISRASLMNYEIDDEHHSRAESCANLKMNAEYLNCFADFYGVSTDYLLCRTDMTTSDVNALSVCKEYGLSESFCEWLKCLEESEPDIKPGVLNGLRLLYERESFEWICFAVNSLVEEYKNYQKSVWAQCEIGTDSSQGLERLRQDMEDIVEEKSGDLFVVLPKSEWIDMLRTGIEREFSEMLDEVERAK